jgi:hypothetical protein
MKQIPLWFYDGNQLFTVDYTETPRTYQIANKNEEDYGNGVKCYLRKDGDDYFFTKEDLISHLMNQYQYRISLYQDKINELNKAIEKEEAQKLEEEIEFEEKIAKVVRKILKEQLNDIKK